MDEQQYNLFEQFMRISRLLVQQHHHKHMAHGPMGNPYRGQGRVLKLLKLKPEISQKDLSELLDMRPQSLGELLAKLERNGYITRAPLESDKRVMLIRLTEKGTETGSQEEEQAAHDDCFSCLSEEEQVMLGEYLGRIGDALQQQLGDGRDWPEHGWHDDHHHRPHPHGHGHGHEHGCDLRQRGPDGPGRFFPSR